ncbi:hypothetical protein GpartN1_g5590.t1 [Galdieria partita]|uniref:Uncharacterized protein n=1 Tax=Galdieria partita TaxID=83374 RepID=A0A9C7Q069_9RHOD|nr:hypothetical protein GpartN1_g5590.t1 [Galdieria partita]
MYSSYQTHPGFEPSAPAESFSDSYNTNLSRSNQQNPEWNRIHVNVPPNKSFVDPRLYPVNENVTIHSPVLAQSFRNDYTNTQNSEENGRTKEEFVRWKDEVFSSLFVTLTFLCTCVLVWSAWWTATALGEQPSICSVKKGIQVPSSVSFPPAFDFKTHQVPIHYTKGGWPVKNSGLRLTVSCLGVVAAFVWAGGVGRLNKKLTRQIYLPVFAAILALSVACIVNDANSLLSVNTSQCPSTGELLSVLSSFKGYSCSCHTGAIFWATLGLDCGISLFSILCAVAL